MTTELENQNQENQENQEPPVVTPPTPTPPPSIDPATQELLQQLRNQSLETQRLQEQLQQLNNARNTPPAEPEPDSSEFLSRPIHHIKRAVQEQVAPLNEFRIQMERQTKYASLKSQIKASNDPRFQYLNNPQVESMVDQMMQNVDPTIQTFFAAYSSAVGQFVMSGNLPTLNTQPATPTVTPPYTPPTPPAAPRSDPSKPELPKFTEEERTVMRKFGLSPEEYHRLTNAGNNVADWKAPS